MSFPSCPPCEVSSFQEAGEDLDPEGIERRADRRYLVEDLHAVAAILDHALDAGDLPRDPVHPRLDLVRAVIAHGRSPGKIPPTGMSQIRVDEARLLVKSRAEDGELAPAQSPPL